MQTSTTYFSEIEDRIDAPFYQEKYLKPMRKLQTKGIAIGDLADYIQSVSNGIEIRKYVSNGTPYLRVSDMKSIFVSLSAVKFVKESIHDVSKKIRLTTNDILISRSGTPGITAIVTREIENAIISSHIMRVVTQQEKLNPFFLAVYLNSLPGRLQIDRITNGCLVSEISHGALEIIKVPQLDIKQQERIANLVMFAESKHTEAINKINEAKKLLEEALDINHQEIKEERIYSVNSTDLTDILTPKFYYPKYLNTLKALKKKFKTIKLGEIADIKRGDEVGSKNYRKYIDRKDSDIPFIRTSDLVNYEIDNYPDYYIDEEIYKELKQDLKPGDIIYTKDGKIGLSAILTAEDKCILASGLARIRIKKDLDPYYVFLVLSTYIGYYQAMQRVVIAATLPHLQQERLEEIEIPIINDKTQNKISQLVEDAFKLKEEKKKLFREALTKVEELLK